MITPYAEPAATLNLAFLHRIWNFVVRPKARRTPTVARVACSSFDQRGASWRIRLFANSAIVVAAGKSNLLMLMKTPMFRAGENAM